MFVHWHLKVFRSVSVYWKQPLLNLSVCILVCSALMSVQHWFEYMCQNHISSPCLGPLCSLHMWFMWFFWVGYVSVGLKVEMHRPEVSSSWQTKWGVQAVWSDLLRISTWWLQPFSFTFANFASPSAALFRNPASELPFFLCRMGITGFCSFFCPHCTTKMWALCSRDCRVLQAHAAPVMPQFQLCLATAAHWQQSKCQLLGMWPEHILLWNLLV